MKRILIAITAGLFAVTAQADDTFNARPADQGALIFRILKAVETHDYQTLSIYTLNKGTDYFGHKNSSSAFIQQDMTQDARSYKWCRFVPDFSTFQTALGHDSIEYDSDVLDSRGKEHKARCRLDIYYTPTSSPRLQSLSLKNLQSGNSGSTVTNPASEQSDESGFKNAGSAMRGDAEMKQQLVGTWTASSDGGTIVLTSDGRFISSDGESSYPEEKWDVRRGNFIEIRPFPESERNYTIISFTKHKCVIQENGHGRDIATWTR
jgi:hypothetical protein